jgi:transposase
MRQALRPSTLVPRGFVVDGASSDDAGLVITVRSESRASNCPGCGTNSERIHSRHRRCLADLPVAGRPVRLVVVARRFHCDAVLCGRRIFAERFDQEVLAPRARRTARLDHIVHHLGLALGGRPAASFARRLMLPVSNDTLLRVVRRRGSPRFVPPTVVGIDDWAWRRNQRYGTIICDLERRKTIALLPDREPATAQIWFSEQPQIEVVARDRGGGYALAAWASRRRRAEKADGALSRTPSSRTIARLMTIGRDGLSKAESVTIAAIESGVPLLVEAREIIAGFQAMVRKKSPADLEPWLERARSSLVASFANGVVKDKAAVSAAITSPWSNGQTEGQITKLKLVKRQMYGRGKLDLLQARVIGAG